MISNSGKDENGKYHGGAAGDQTGHEWEIRTWYNRPWDCVLRAPTKEIAAKLNELSIKSANNDNIGYNQYQRLTYWTELAKVGYDPSKITKKCDADCSSGAIANVKAVGHILNDEKLKAVSESGYTGTMKNILTNAGFKVLTDPKYLTSEKYLEPGDILLNIKSHCAVYIVESQGDAAAAPVATKPISEIVNEVIAGKWGNEPDRKNRLVAAGYNYDEIKAAVNAKLKKPASTTTAAAPAPKKDASYSAKVIAKSGLNIRNAGSMSAAKVGAYSYGTVVKILSESNGWGKTDRGWISLKYINKV